MIPTATKPINPDTTAVGNGTIAGLVFPFEMLPSRGSAGTVEPSTDPKPASSSASGPVPPRFGPALLRLPNTSLIDEGTVPPEVFELAVPTCTVSANAIPADNKTRAAQARPTMRFSIASSRFSRMIRSGEFPPEPLRVSLAVKISDGRRGINPRERQNEENLL